jgi:type VI secretion system secreted protein Hcp
METTSGFGRRDVLKTGALGVGALAGMSAVSASAASAAPAVAAQSAALLGSSDIFLKIDGIDGESTDSKHAGEIEISSFSWGVVADPKGPLQELSVASSVSKASPKLMLACASGSQFKKAVLNVRNSGDFPQDYYRLTLEGVRISSYNSSGSSGSGAVPTDQFSMNYTRIGFSYSPQNADGSLGTPVETTYPPR